MNTKARLNMKAQGTVNGWTIQNGDYEPIDDYSDTYKRIETGRKRTKNLLKLGFIVLEIIIVLAVSMFLTKF
ncbi:MAG: hypothetical protein V1720_01530 [bacterium]